MKVSGSALELCSETAAVEVKADARLFQHVLLQQSLLWKPVFGAGLVSLPEKGADKLKVEWIKNICQQHYSKETNTSGAPTLDE